MTLEDFEILEKKLQEITAGLLKDDERISLFVRSLTDDELHYTGTDCTVCLAHVIKIGIEIGAIKHKFQHDEEVDEDEEKIIKH